MNIINLTPHAVNLITRGQSTFTFEPSGTVARCAAIDEKKDPIEYAGTQINVVHTTFGQVENLPEPEEGTIYLVSSLVKSAAADRNDLAVPSGFVRDDHGNIVGCTALNM